MQLSVMRIAEGREEQPHWLLAPFLWSVAPFLWLLAPSLWSVAGSIAVTTINKTITNSCTIQTCSDVSVNC